MTCKAVIWVGTFATVAMGSRFSTAGSAIERSSSMIRASRDGIARPLRRKGDALDRPDQLRWRHRFRQVNIEAGVDGGLGILSARVGRQRDRRQLLIGIGIILLFVAFFWALYTFGSPEPSASPSTAPTAYPPAAAAHVSTPTPPPPAPTRYFSSVDEAKQEAVRLYPSLGVAGSQFNSAFLARHREYQQLQPSYFNDNAWPVRIAEEISRAGYR